LIIKVALLSFSQDEISIKKVLLSNFLRLFIVTVRLNLDVDIVALSVIVGSFELETLLAGLDIIDNIAFWICICIFYQLSDQDLISFDIAWSAAPNSFVRICLLIAYRELLSKGVLFRICAVCT
jgi:hypothetical protein